MTSLRYRIGGYTLTTAMGLAFLSSNALNAQQVPLDWESISPRIGLTYALGADKRFGHSTDISNGTLIVGAYGDKLDAEGLNELGYAGAAYLYDVDENGNWIFGQKIVPNDREAGAYFGGSVAIYEDWAAVGADGKDYHPEGGLPMEDAGAIYIYHKDETGHWEEVQKIVASIPYEFSFLGYAVDMHNQSIIAGAPGEGHDLDGENYMPLSGAAYAFEFLDEEWVENQKLVAFDREPYAAFGLAVSMDAQRAIIGAPYEDHDENGLNPAEDAGAIYPYDYMTAEELLAEAGWLQDPEGTPKITSGDDRDPFDYFGNSLCVSGSYLVAGAPLEDEDAEGENHLQDAGAAYVFEYNESLVEILKVIPRVRQEHAYFGTTVLGKQIEKVQRPELDLSDIPLLGTFFDVVVGSSGDGTDAGGMHELPGAGSATELLIFVNATIIEEKAASVSEIIYQQKLVPPDRALGDNFGVSLAQEGNNLVVGADLKDYVENDDTTFNVGIVYLVDLCPSSYDSITVAFCDTYISPSGKHTWTEPGTYNDTINNSLGCDSIITIDLVMINFDNTLIQDVNSLMSNEPDAEYQWLNCDLDYVQVADATSKNFSPDESGNYAVQLIKGPCTDTSECQSITITSTPGTSAIKEPRIYPNPATEDFSIDLWQVYSEVEVEIFNAIGQSILTRRYSDLHTIDFSLDIPDGIYSIALRLNNDKSYWLQLVKQ